MVTDRRRNTHRNQLMRITHLAGNPLERAPPTTTERHTMDAGIFHDAHEVNEIKQAGNVWVATFATREMALWFALRLGENAPTREYEVEPV